MCWKFLSFTSTMSKKWRFPLRISSVNVTKPQETADLVTFTEEIPNGKLYFYAVRAAVRAAVLTTKLALNLGIFYTSKAKYAGIRSYYRYVKYARIRGFTDPYFPVWDQNRRFCPKIRSEETCILTYFTQCTLYSEKKYFDWSTVLYLNCS